jgi:predicted nucleic acid-binding protein
MLIVDASCLYEVLADTPRAEPIRERMRVDAEHAAPHLVDAEVLGVIRRNHLNGRLDATAAGQAVEDLRDWPGERFGHRSLLDRAWDLRSAVRSWDALYIALAEVLRGTLITTDKRLGRVAGLACEIDVFGAG